MYTATIDIGIVIRNEYSICPGYDNLGSSGSWLVNGHHIITADAMNIRCSTIWML